MGSTPVGVNCSAHSFPPNFSAPRLPAQCRQVRSSPFCYVIEPLFPRASFPVCPVHITPHHLFDHSALPHSAYMTKEFHFPLYNHLENIRFSLHSSSDFRVLDSLLPSYVQYTSIAFHLERQQSFLIGFSEGPRLCRVQQRTEDTGPQHLQLDMNSYFFASSYFAETGHCS